MKELPDWVKKHKKKGVEIRQFKKKYYAYEIASVWDPEKKRARKITKKFLGRIKPDGLMKPKRQQLLDSLQSVTVKEFGATHFLTSKFEDVLNPLKQHFPRDWKEITLFALTRLLYSSPIKNIQHHVTSSHASDLFPDARVSPKRLSETLYSVGRNRASVTAYMKQFVAGVDFAVIDLTHVFSSSENVFNAVVGHNSENDYTPQVNLVLLFSIDERQPVFFRIVPGSIRDVSVIPLTLREAGVKNAVVIGDKGFISTENIGFLEENGLHYILPLKRNDASVDYGVIQKNDKRGFKGYFIFEKRSVWYYELFVGGRRIVVFLDERLKAEESKDFLSRIEKESVGLNEFYDKQFQLGTIAVVTNTLFSAKEVYEHLKSRIEIEVVFDAFKNVLNADRSYMRDDVQLDGWLFVNFVSLLLYYRVYNLLAASKLLNHYSVRDVLLHLSRVHKLRFGGEWVLSEVPKSSRKICEKLQLDLHIT